MPYLPQWPKSIPYLRPKRLKNHTLWGRTYSHSPYNVNIVLSRIFFAWRGRLQEQIITEIKLTFIAQCAVFDKTSMIL